MLPPGPASTPPLPCLASSRRRACIHAVARPAHSQCHRSACVCRYSSACLQTYQLRHGLARPTRNDPRLHQGCMYHHQRLQARANFAMVYASCLRAHAAAVTFLRVRAALLCLCCCYQCMCICICAVVVLTYVLESSGYCAAATQRPRAFLRSLEGEGVSWTMMYRCSNASQW